MGSVAHTNMAHLNGSREQFNTENEAADEL